MHHEYLYVKDHSLYLLIDTEEDRIIKRFIHTNNNHDATLEKLLKSMYQHYEKIGNLDKQGYYICNICKIYHHISDFEYNHYIHFNKIDELKHLHLQEIRNFRLYYKLGSYAPFNYLW